LITVVSNDEPVSLPEGTTVAGLLDHLGLGAKWVLVERNGEPVERRSLGSTVLADGDRLELVRAVAGG
jgi:sulfur carrier protein